MIARIATLWILMVVGMQHSEAQILLQLEKYRVPKAEKFFTGSTITFKVADYPDEWRRETIERLVPDENIIVTNMGMVKLEEIIEFRTYNPSVKAASYVLQTFGVVWTVYGGIAAVAADYDFGWDTGIIGGSAIASGWLLKKLFYKNTYKLGKKHRLRILDISWPEPINRP